MRNKDKNAEEVFEEIVANSNFSIAHASVENINELNVLVATHRAMIEAVSKINCYHDAILIDGNKKPKLPGNVHTIIKGDNKSASIAEASIIAKVTRDRLMGELGKNFPYYNWEKNVGYGTKTHIEAIKKYGVTIHHRINYKPIINMRQKNFDF